MNTISLAKVQTADRTMNQLQDNIGNTLTQVGSSVNQLTIIGEIKSAALTLSQFQQQSGKNWVACDGSSALGTQYNKITNALTVPNIASVGSQNYFIRVN